MNKNDLLKHFNRWFQGQTVYVSEKKAQSGSDIARLAVFNPVVDAFNREAETFGMKVQYLPPGKRTKLPKDHENRKCENRLSVQIRRYRGAHKIGRVLNY